MSMALLPDALADDASLPLNVRVLIELQRRGAAMDWTPPLATSELARRLDRSRSAVGRALSWAVARGYVQRQRASLPRGGRGARYRATLELTPRVTKR